jgi:DNA-binding transcriptional LysR family regulator
MDQIIDPDLQAIRYAVTVAEHLSFRRAAETLKIHQPALSRRIRRLEKAIGASLFERYLRGLRLTHAGRIFIRDAHYVLMLLDRALDPADRSGRAETG